MREVRVAAIQCTCGEKPVVITGRDHGIIIGRFAARGHKTPVRCEQGFIDSQGQFIGRAEAAQIAFAAGQIEKEKPYLCSEDLRRAGL